MSSFADTPSHPSTLVIEALQHPCSDSYNTDLRQKTPAQALRRIVAPLVQGNDYEVGRFFMDSSNERTLEQ